MGPLVVERLASPTEPPTLVGTIDAGRGEFAYAPEYLSNGAATPLSCSLPLQADPFPEQAFRPYFEGLVPDGSAREALAQQLGVSAEDYLALLARCGRECIGDVLVWDREEGPVAHHDSTYEPVSAKDLRSIFSSMSDVAVENIGTRLSLGGSQGKIGLAWDEGERRWLRPLGLAASTHVLKVGSLPAIPEIEFICMTAARACGIEAADVRLLDAGRPVLAVERFDRSRGAGESGLVVTRLHQEDLAQAFGIVPWAKYLEIEGGTLRSISRLIRERSLRPAVDLEWLCRIVCFDYLVGNCDNHIKNISLLWRPGADAPVVAPAYDIVSTTYFERFSREMAFALGGVRDIDVIGVDELTAAARDMGLQAKAMAELCVPIVDHATDAIAAAGEQAGELFESSPFIAEDLLEDVKPRLQVLERLCRRAR